MTPDQHLSASDQACGREGWVLPNYPSSRHGWTEKCNRPEGHDEMCRGAESGKPLHDSPHGKVMRRGK